MTTDKEPEVKDIGVSYIKPAGKDEENIDETEETEPESSKAETEGDEESDEDSKKPDELVKNTPKVEPKVEDDDGLADVEDETPRERALRSELTRVKGKLRQERGDEIFEKPEKPAKKELTAEKASILAKYKPEEIASLREVLPALAEEMGFVRNDELQGNSYTEKSQDALDTFLDKHPEYTPENDKDGTLWNAFKSEFSLYKTPANPKDFSKIFERIHRDVFGIKPAGALKTVSAQQEKAKVASHAGSSPARSAPEKKSTTKEGLRLDMLVGFDDDELAELSG